MTAIDLLPRALLPIIRLYQLFRANKEAMKNCNSLFPSLIWPSNSPLIAIFFFVEKDLRPCIKNRVLNSITISPKDSLTHFWILVLENAINTMYLWRVEDHVQHPPWSLWNSGHNLQAHWFCHDGSSSENLGKTVILTIVDHLIVRAKLPSTLENSKILASLGSFR